MTTTDLPARLLAAITEEQQRDSHDRDCLLFQEPNDEWCDRGCVARASQLATGLWEIVDSYVLTVRLRDEAAERLRAQGQHKDRNDLDEWSRADLEATVLVSVIDRLARAYGLNPEEG